MTAENQNFITVSLILIPDTNQVLVDNAVGGSKEGEHMRDEVALVVVQVVPVSHVLAQVNLNKLLNYNKIPLKH